MSEMVAAEASGLRPRASGFVSAARRLFVARGDDMRLALGALNGHKLRSGLTLLGIVIGVFTVVAMMALLNGLRGSIDKQMGALGADVFEIQRWPAVQFGPLSPEVWARKKITLANVLQLRELLPQAKQVGGDIWASAPPSSSPTTTCRWPAAAPSPSRNRSTPPAWRSSARR